MVKEPEVGFMQATYWQLWMSFRVSFCLSYLREGGGATWAAGPEETSPGAPALPQSFLAGGDQKPQ